MPASAPSTDSASANTGHTSPAVSHSSTSAITTVLMTNSPNVLSTVTSLITSNQELSTSQNGHTGTMETSSNPQSTPLTEVTTSALSSSPSGSTPAQTGSQGTSSPEATTNPFSSSVSNTKPATSEMPTLAPSTESTSGSTGHTSPAVSPSSTSAITGISMTNSPNVLSTMTTPITSNQELSTSQNGHTGTMETSSNPQNTPLTEVTTSTPSSSPSGSTPAQTGSQGTSSPEATTNPFSSSVSNTNPPVTEMPTSAPSTDSTSGSTGHTSPAVSHISTSIITTVSMTNSPNVLSTMTTSITSNQESSTSQNGHTGTMETNSNPQSTSLTEVTTSAPSSFPSGSTPAQTGSQGTSSPQTTSSPFTSSVSNTNPPKTEMPTSAPSTDNTSGSEGHTSPDVSQSSTSIITTVSMTNSPNVLSTVTSPITSNQEFMETSSNPQSTPLTEVTTSALSSFPSGSTPAQTGSQGTSSPQTTSSPFISTQTGSQGTSSPEATTNPFSSSVSNTKTATSEMPTSSPSTDSTSGRILMTNSPNVLSTVTSPITSNEELSTSSQNGHTGTMETSSNPQSTPLTEVTTSTLFSFPSGSTPAQTGSQGTSSPEPTTNPFTSSVSNTNPPKTEMPTSAPSTDSTSGSTGHTSLAVSQSSTSAITGISMTNSPNVLSTVTSPITSNQELSTSSQNGHTGTMETSSNPQSTPLTEVTTSALTSFPSGSTPVQTGSQGTSSSEAITNPFSSSVSNTNPPKTEMPNSSPSTDSTSGSTWHTSAHVTESFGVITSGVSSSTLTGQSTVLAYSTSTQPPSTYSQSYQTTSMATSSIYHTSTLTEVTTENHSSSSSGPTVTDTFSHGTSSSGESATYNTGKRTTTSSLKTDSGRGTSLPATSWTLTTPSSTTASRSTAPPLPILPEQGIALFPYGTSPHIGDLRLFDRTVDFTSPLFKIQIGFPLGSSLRDSFYFTDNGQIVFPESDYSIFSYPNPPQRGFTGREHVAMVAPFWADADFSSSRGTIFYQEYSTLYDGNSELIRGVEALIHEFTGDWSYKAKWTLKVTWVDVPTYPARWSFGTNTYQAILSTDGSSSYALFLYQSGGMRWDVAQGLRKQVLMGFSSGDGYFENSPLILRPAMEKYRPDRFLDSKLGIRGLQVYRLHKEVRPNYRLRCLQWLKSQPQSPSWGWGWSQISCPCSWQQGRRDLRFWRVNTGWWDGSSRQLCSFSSWRGGVCCSYGHWGEFREGWRMHSPWQFEQEREAQNWCCRWNDKPSLCAEYRRVRPRFGCAWYRPPRPAWTYGDPHITTLDNASYTFNGLGDFLLVQARDANSSFLLEGRTAQTGSAKATNFIAFAAQYNTSSLASPVTVQWFLEPNDTIRVLYNNRTVAFDTNHTEEVFNTTGVLMTQNGSQVSASFDGTVTISVIALSNILHASSSLPEGYRHHTKGLLGVWNDNPEDDFRMPNGSTIPSKSSEETIFHYGMTWQINGTGLLGMRTDPLPSNFTPVFLSQLRNTSDANLTSGCRGDTQCEFDALATGNAGIGQSTNTILETFQNVNGTLNQYPPSINCSRDIRAYKGRTETVDITSDSKDVTFTLTDSQPFRSLFLWTENGSLQWTPPASPEACTLEILARDARTNLSSVLQPQTTICFCNTESQCLYNETSREGNSSLEVASCKCDGDTFGRFCERSKDLCEEPCFPNVPCTPGKGCEACPPNMTGDGRHCAALVDPLACQNHSCPANHCYNHGHCYISGAPDCQPACTCPPAFTDARCLLAGNSFTPTIAKELPLRTIMLSLREDENASLADVNASVSATLTVPLPRSSLPARPSDKSIQHWRVTSHFQYRPRGPVIHFLNDQLMDAVVEAFLLQAPRGRQMRSSGEARKNVNFFPISRADVHHVKALNLGNLSDYFLCEGYKGYELVYSPQDGVTCVSPCSEGYCHNGGQCQHLPDGPQCSCASFTIYTSWGERCEHLSVKLGAFFGILFGALGALLLLGILAFVIFHFCGSMNKFSYPLDSEL
uniref:Mucin-4 n=1 Tax=Peromyscus maniculatus bairdii TaxID=230844 RepID=A0A8C8UDM4_PERMB